MKTVRDICRYIGKAVGPESLTVETGCMYTCPPGNEEHNTTSNIYECITKWKGTLYSLDIDPTHIKFAQEYLSSLQTSGAGAYFIEGDSVSSMVALSKALALVGASVDVLCLDSKEFDEEHMVNEFNAIRGNLNKDKHFVLVDDIHNDNSVKYKKMVPILKELGYSWIEVPTPTGMFVAAKGYSLP